MIQHRYTPATPALEPEHSWPSARAAVLRGAGHVSRARRQAGAVLPTAMILMLIMAVFALSGMSDTVLQQRMAGNLRDRDTAFQAAEAALREGEAWLQVNPLGAVAATAMSFGDAAAWDGASPAPTGTTTTLYSSGDEILALASNPAYHVGPPQLIRLNPGETPAKFEQIFPVSARANGATATTLVVVRSTFRPR